MVTAETTKTVKTSCCYCGVGCGILIHRRRDGSMEIEGDPDNPVNRGKLCSKGLNLLHTVRDQSDRLLYPEMRDARHLPLRRVNWDEALERAAAVFRTMIKKYGPDSVGFYVSGQCLTEEYYLANKIMKGFVGSNNIDTNSRLCMSSAVAGYRLSLGEDSVPCSYEDLDLADLYFVAGANPAYCHPILFRRIEGRLSGDTKVAKMIVVDPRRTQSAAMADLHLAIQPGTDITLFNALARRLIEMGQIDQAFIKDHTEGFEDLRDRVFSRTLAEAAAICRIDQADIETAAQWIAEAKGFLSLWAMGLNQSVVGVNKNVSLINLNLITGKIGKPGNGPFSLTGQPNAMGGREVGGLANLMSAHRDLKNPAHRAEIAKYWGVPSVPEKPGFTAGEMMDALIDGRLKALWVICTNPLVSWPDLNKAEQALRNAKFLIVQDISSRSDTLKFADLVLPAAGWLEKEGTMTNSERRITHLPPLVDAPGEALPDAEILIRFAHKMGWKKSFDFATMVDVYREHAGLTKGTNIDVSGLDYERLQTTGTVQWPVPKPGHPGTPRLFTDGQFYRPGGRAKLNAVEDANTSEPPTAEFPLVLTTGRIRDQWHTMTRTGKVTKLKNHEPVAKLDIHPQDAAARGIEDGHLVRIFNPLGEVNLRARLTDELKPGVVFLPMHWGRVLNRSDVRANNLVVARWDPISKEPDLKYSIVQVERRQAPKQRVVVIGAGAASMAFVQAYRQDNRQDDLIVFSKEPLPFYDRIRLPEVVEGTTSWESLVVLDKAASQDLALEVHQNLAIVEIDRAGKMVRDAKGNWHAYDTLVLATGSRPAWPKDAPKNLPGLHALRTVEDAEQILSAVEVGRNVVIVGGGLLGLELAAALKARDFSVHVVQRSARLMDKQLDEIAAELLREEMIDRGVTLHFQDEVLVWRGEDRLEEIILSSGTRLQKVTLIYAVGTVPNVELARTAGLTISRGVVVDAAMRTSDASIIALGEVAEYDGELFGITAAAEEQAQIAARFLAGDAQAVYEGSISQNLLKVPNLSLVSVGLVKPPEGDESYEQVVFYDKTQRTYKKCVIQNDRLVGALLVGDKSDYLQLRNLIRSGEELGTKRAKILRSEAAKPQHSSGKVICSCTSVDEGMIAYACQNGAKDLAGLMEATGAGTGCGSCRPELVTILKARAGGPA